MITDIRLGMKLVAAGALAIAACGSDNTAMSPIETEPGQSVGTPPKAGTGGGGGASGGAAPTVPRAFAQITPLQLAPATGAAGAL